MAGTTSRRKWIIAAVVTAGVGAGAMTAAGASTTSGTGASAAEAAKLHQELVTLGHQESSLQGTLRAKSQRPAATAAAGHPAAAPAAAPATGRAARTEPTEPTGSTGSDRADRARRADRAGTDHHAGRHPVGPADDLRLADTHHRRCRAPDRHGAGADRHRAGTDHHHDDHDHLAVGRRGRVRGRRW